MSKTVALITGSSSGIGRATAVKFASEGWNVVVTGRNALELNATAKKCQEFGVEVLSVVADLNVSADIERLILNTTERFSRLDVLVNNAGVSKDGGIVETSMDEFDRIMNTNLRAVYQLSKLAVPYLIKTKGSIVNVSSTLSSTATNGYIAYSTSKAALDHFTRCLAMELASKQVRVNSVNPGAIPTSIFKTTLAASDEAVEQMMSRLALIHPLGRIGTVEEVAAAIYYLASDASSFTTGCQLPVDGGILCTTSMTELKSILRQ